MPKTKDLGEFKSVVSGGYTYPAILPAPSAKQHSARYWRVRTFADPESVGTFIANSLGRSMQTFIRFANEDVIVVDATGRIVPSALPHLVPLLSDDEVRLLQLFGMDLAKLVRRSA